MSDQEKVLDFISRNPTTVTRLEIAGGTGLTRDVVQVALEALLAAGDVVAASNGPSNTCLYRPAASAVEPAPVVLDPRSAAQIWSEELAEHERVMRNRRAIISQNAFLK